MKETSTSNLLQKMQEESLCKKQGLNLKEQKGITLIALVVTIVVLLILAGVTITIVLGEGGILNMAKRAADETKQSIVNDQADIAELTNQLENILGGGSGSSSGGGASPSTGSSPEISGALEVGSIVKYNPSGTYDWKAKYCSSTKEEGKDDVTLNSTSGSDFNISSWKVLSINEGKVELVPEKETTGKVYLGQAQGYNNGVKLLNDACSSLYGNEGKGITARSISMEDIEKYMTDAAKNSAHETPYGAQPYNAYTKANSWYPAIYAQENKSVINGQEISGGLGMSSQDNFIERTASVVESGQTESKPATDGKLQATTSIQPYQTYWYKEANSMKTAFEKYDDTNSYYNLIMPSETSTTYWVASRCVHAASSGCYFRVRYVFSGSMSAYDVFNSNATYGNSRALFPVVTLSSELMKSDEEGNFKVE